MKRMILILALVFISSAVVLAAKRFTTSQSGQVNAPASAVWALLIDAGNWADWNPAVIESKIIKGDGESVGSVVKFLPMIGDKKAVARVKLKIAISEKPDKLEFHAKVPGAKIVFGFTISEKDGVSKVTSYETITGFMAGRITQENLDKEHHMWVEAIRKKLETRENL